jgi:hypothetical protein
VSVTELKRDGVAVDRPIGWTVGSRRWFQGWHKLLSVFLQPNLRARCVWTCSVVTLPLSGYESEVGTQVTEQVDSCGHHHPLSIIPKTESALVSSKFVLWNLRTWLCWIRRMSVQWTGHMNVIQLSTHFRENYARILICSFLLHGKLCSILTKKIKNQNHVFRKSATCGIVLNFLVRAFSFKNRVHPFGGAEKNATGICAKMMKQKNKISDSRLELLISRSGGGRLIH